MTERLKALVATHQNKLLQHYGPESKDIGRDLLDLDPTKPKNSFAPWIVRMAAKGHLPKEDFYKVPEELSLFDRQKQNLPADKRDINKYKNLPELSEALTKHGVRPKERAYVTGESIESKQAREESAVLHEDKDHLVVMPFSARASCHYGAGTRWCTAAKKGNRFYSYSNDAPLVYAIDKKNNVKHAIHKPPGDKLSIYNVDDNLTSKSKFLSNYEHDKEHKDRLSQLVGSIDKDPRGTASLRDALKSRLK